jgi:hypothetical protein
MANDKEMMVIVHDSDFFEPKLEPPESDQELPENNSIESEEISETLHTGKSLSEAFILTSTNPHYDKRLFIDLPVQYMKTTTSEHGENMLCTQIGFLFLF